MSAFEKYGFTDKEISKFILGDVLNNIREKVVLAPCWMPETVDISETQLLSENPVKIWDCKAEDLYFTYILTNVGAGICSDIVLALKETRCRDILFIGSAGALSEEIKIGDIFLPDAIYSGDGLCRYLSEDIWEDVFGKEVAWDLTLQDNICLGIEKICNEEGITYHRGKNISVSTIYSQYRHIDTFLQMGCVCLEMESAAAVMSARLIGRSCAVVLCISDNSILNQSLITVSKELTAYRKHARKIIFPKLLNIYMNI